jgi:hypothetical protein
MALACPTATLQTGKDGGSVQLVSHSANGDCADRIWVSVPMGLPFLARRCESVLDSAAFLANTV